MNILLNIFFLMRIEAYRPVIKAIEYPLFPGKRQTQKRVVFS